MRRQTELFEDTLLDNFPRQHSSKIRRTTVRVWMQAITEQAAKEGHVGDHAKIGIVTVSDRASQGAYVDEGGPALLSFS